MQQTSAAHGFFLANKDLFQYEKYVGGQDLSDADGRQSFLEQYREIDRDHPPAPAFSDLRFSLRHSSPRKYPVNNSTALLPEFVVLQSTPSILQDLRNPHYIVPPVSQYPPKRTSPHEQLQHKSLGVIHEITMPQQQHSTPDGCVAASATATNTHNLSLSPSLVRIPVKITESVSKLSEFRLPKLAALLVDRETRAAATAYKSWDVAHKIEVLVGGKCVGRVSAASRNIPPSIRSRLRASANVSVRRERLYDLLRKDYDELSKSYTQ